MLATATKFLDFLKKSPQFVIPIYQRTYSWTEKECRQLWDDILRAGGNEAVNAHFVGSIVYIERGLSNLTTQEPMLVIDGQQRLTTLSLILTALARALEKLEETEREPVEGFSPRKVRNYYLLNPEEEGERHYKLLLSQTDKDTLVALVGDRAPPQDVSIRITENFALFTSLIDGRKGDLKTVCNGLAKLVVVDVALNRQHDNPQLIFESMNSTGRELSQADLIRNFILMGLETPLQTRLYVDFWRPMEVEFGQEGYVAYFDAFMRHYLTVRTGEIPRIDEVYEAFKAYARRPDMAAKGVEVLVREIRQYAIYYCAMALAEEKDDDLALAFQDLRELKVDVAYPFLLELYDDYAQGVLSKDDLLAAVRLVEAYVFRRAICAIPTNSMNKTFATAGRSLKKDRYLESIFAQFLSLPTYRRFPSDDEFKRAIQTRDLYNFRTRSYWIRRLENHGRKERVSIDEYSIEHIMPQSDGDPTKLPAVWRAELGDEWERIWGSHLHTLGNLTLTGYNSELSARSFLEKRDMEGGFKDSPLRINKSLASLTVFNEEAIRTRAAALADQALNVWKAPELDADILEAYRVKPSITSYTLSDHPHLGTKAMRELFEALRKEVLALDPNVSEEILKFYIAYKAETNFVDVVPQAKRLRLSLNMSFADINDPRGVCKDVSSVGRWGNGDVEVGLASMNELPYVIGLVRQSFERQMGDGANS
jgi:uncharacterized protein with ParB-like and HNH nuclease domain/predicted transport protein